MEIAIDVKESNTEKNKEEIKNWIHAHTINIVTIEINENEVVIYPNNSQEEDNIKHMLDKMGFVYSDQ